MDNIKDIVLGVMGKLSGGQMRDRDSLDDLWQDLLNDKEKKHCHVVGEKDGIIFVQVDSSAWFYQINTRKKTILDEMKKSMPGLKEIRIKIGKHQ